MDYNELIANLRSRTNNLRGGETYWNVLIARIPSCPVHLALPATEYQLHM
jgi:hypothetical protein